MARCGWVWLDVHQISTQLLEIYQLDPISVFTCQQLLPVQLLCDDILEFNPQVPKKAFDIGQEILEQSVIAPHSGEHDFGVGLAQSARKSLDVPNSHEETDNPVDVLEKGIMNLTDLLTDLQESHNVALENMKAKVIQEHRATLQRQHRLKGHLEEFKSRVVRAQRGIGRLKSFVDTADFGCIAHVPEQLENDPRPHSTDKYQQGSNGFHVQYVYFFFRFTQRILRCIYGTL